MTKRPYANNVSTYSYYDNSPCTGCVGSQGQLTTSTDGPGKHTYYYYDANSRMTKMKNPLWDGLAPATSVFWRVHIGEQTAMCSGMLVGARFL